jgi:hypothetical protein
MITSKRGDTFAFILRKTDLNGDPEIGSASKMKAQIRNNKDILAGTFDIVETATPGDYMFSIRYRVSRSKFSSF